MYIAYNIPSASLRYPDLFAARQLEVQIGTRSLHQFLYGDALNLAARFIGRIGSRPADQYLRARFEGETLGPGDGIEQGHRTDGLKRQRPTNFPCHADRPAGIFDYRNRHEGFDD